MPALPRNAASAAAEVIRNFTSRCCLPSLPDRPAIFWRINFWRGGKEKKLQIRICFNTLIHGQKKIYLDAGKLKMEPRNSELSELLKKHGLSVVPHNGWLAVNGTLPAMRCSYEINDAGTAMVLIETFLGQGRIIEECFAGVGPDKESAYQDGIMNFCISSFHVLLSAFWNKIDENQVTLENWTIAGQKWVAVIGNFTMRTGQGVQVSRPDNLFHAIESEVKKETFSESVAWIRVFYFHLNGKMLASEFVINNLNRPDSEAVVQNLKWESVDGFYSVRNFMVLKKVISSES